MSSLTLFHEAYHSSLMYSSNEVVKSLISIIWWIRSPERGKRCICFLSGEFILLRTKSLSPPSLLPAPLLYLTLFQNSNIILKHFNEILNECVIYYVIMFTFFTEGTVYFRLPTFLQPVPVCGGRDAVCQAGGSKSSILVSLQQFGVMESTLHYRQEARFHGSVGEKSLNISEIRVLISSLPSS